MHRRSPIVRDARMRLCDGMVAPHFVADLDAAPDEPVRVVLATDARDAAAAALGAAAVLVWTDLPHEATRDPDYVRDPLRVIVTAAGGRWLVGRTEWPRGERQLDTGTIRAHLTATEQARLARMPPTRPARVRGTTTGGQGTAARPRTVDPSCDRMP